MYPGNVYETFAATLKENVVSVEVSLIGKSALFGHTSSSSSSVTSNLRGKINVN